MSVIVNINHETGDLSQYDATGTDGGDLSVTAGAALAGTGYGLSCLIDDTTAIYARANVSSSTGIARARFYIDPNSLTMAENDLFTIFYFNNATVSLGRVELNYASSNYRIRAGAYNDTGGVNNTSYYTITDASHYIEINMLKAATNVSADGSIQIFIDGVSKETKGSVDNYDRFDTLARVYLGALAGLDAGTSGTYYLDELIVNDDGSEIGPYSAGSPWYAYAQQ